MKATCLQFLHLISSPPSIPPTFPCMHHEKFVTADVKQSTDCVDRGVREADTAGKVPSSWQATSEGASALLRAARDADDTALEQIAAHMRKFGLADMDVNIADSSGRVSHR